MDAIAIIPARYASTRLPGKPLLDRTGKPLIQHVVEAAGQCRHISRVVVATDDRRIREAVERFGGEVVMTSPDHTCGTDRIAEAVSPARLALDDSAAVVNVQGDEPEMPSACIDRLVEVLASSGAPMATLAATMPAALTDDPNKVKVVLARDGTAMYFSRARIPADRDGTGDVDWLLHLGIYAYRAGFLKTLSGLAATPAEQAERLEQLRALENGYKIAVAVVDYHGAGIDTPEDYRRFVERFRRAGGD